MRKYFIIKVVVAGMVSAIVLSGCDSKSNATKYYNQGLTYIEADNYIDAVEVLEKAVELDVENIEYLTYLGMAEIQTCKYDDAITTFQEIIDLDDTHVDAYRGIGIAYYEKGSYSKAIEQFQKIEDMSSEYDDIRLDALKYMGVAYYEMEDYEHAIECFTTVLDNCSKQEKAEIYFLRGASYVELNEEDNAVMDYEASLKIDDSSYDMYCRMFTSLYDAGYIERGESYLKRVVDLEDSDDLTIGKTYYLLGNYEQATSYLKKAIQEGLSEAAFYLAKTYENQGNYISAETVYKDYINDYPNDASIYNQYGAYLINLQEYKQALVYIETGLSIEKNTAEQELLYNQAVCYEYLGDYEQALTLFTEYVATYPEDKVAQKEYCFLQTR